MHQAQNPSSSLSKPLLLSVCEAEGSSGMVWHLVRSISMSPAKFPRVCPMQAPIVIALSWRWGSIDRSGNKEAQQQRRQRGLGEGNGWEKPVHREEGKQKKKNQKAKKSMGRIGMTSYRHYYIISPVLLIYRSGNHSPLAPAARRLLPGLHRSPKKAALGLKRQLLG